MTYLTGLLLLIILACAVAIYRLRGDNEALFAALEDRDVDKHYLLQRNRDLNAELLNASVTRPSTQTASTSGPLPSATVQLMNHGGPLPAEHPQKRKPKSIRGKRK